MGEIQEKANNKFYPSGKKPCKQPVNQKNKLKGWPRDFWMCVRLLRGPGAFIPRLQNIPKVGKNLFQQT